MEDYIANKGEIEALKEDIQLIDEKMAVEEFMFLGLRLLEGVSKHEFRSRFGKEMNAYYGDTITGLVHQGLLVEDANRLKLTRKGIDVSNHVLAHFIFE